MHEKSDNELLHKTSRSAAACIVTSSGEALKCLHFLLDLRTESDFSLCCIHRHPEPALVTKVPQKFRT